MRARGWVVAGVLIAAVIAAATLAGHGRPAMPAGGPRPKVQFGAHVKPPRASSDLVYTNAWAASSGVRSIAVYAGSDAGNRQNGLFKVLRQTHAGQKLSSVVVHGSGAITLLRPSAPQTEQAAFNATLHFVTASGATGTLDLGDDRVSLSH